MKLEIFIAIIFCLILITAAYFIGVENGKPVCQRDISALTALELKECLK